MEYLVIERYMVTTYNKTRLRVVARFKFQLYAVIFKYACSKHPYIGELFIVSEYDVYKENNIIWGGD